MLADISLPALIYGLAVIGAAYFVRGITGFGSALIAIPLLLLIHVPIDTVVPVVVLLDYVGSAMQGLKNRRAIVWRHIWPTLPFMVIGVATALYTFHAVDALVLTKALAVFIIMFALYQLLAREPRKSELALWAVPAGGFGGFAGTLFGTGGPFYVAYLQLRGLDKSAFRATFATLYLIDGGNRLFGYLAIGLINSEVLTYSAVFLPVMAISLYAGGHVHVKIGPDAFKRGISLLLVVSGIALLLR
jgi:uncharacterized membrane protein YfcA